MERDIGEILIPCDRIAQRVNELGAEIASDMARDGALSPDGEIILVPVLTGSIIFVADLMRRLPLRIRIGFVTVTSYPGAAVESRGADLVGALPHDLEDRHVLIVDDILDSGRTLRLLREAVAARSPRTIRTCVLLRKIKPEALATPCEYIGFDIADQFVVGYGLDFNDYYRNLPDIATLREAP